MKVDNIKLLAGGGMDTNSAPEFISKDDFIAAYNFRVTGTTLGEEGKGTNPESTRLISSGLHSGINKGIGGGSFEDVGLVVYFRYNSAGYNQIVVYNSVTKTEQVIYEDITNSGGLPLLPLNPQNYIKAILVNETYLFWVASGIEVGYTNLNTLTSGGYGTVLAEDLSLLKPQCLTPITGVYGSDPGQPANYLFGNLPQFNVQYINADYNYSAWSTWSKRIVPYQQNTPTLGADVTQNNYIIVSVNIGSIRVTTLNIACRFALQIFSIIKSVDRTYILTLPNVAISVATEIYEIYNPTTNIYSFVFYNNTIAIPVAPTETDLAYDAIWPANTIGLLNGNITALSDLQVGYVRPVIDVTVGATGYNPNIDIPAGTFPNPLVITGVSPGASGSGAGNHKRIMQVTYYGVPHTGDVFTVTIADIRNATVKITYTYTVPSSQDGNLSAAVASFAATIPGSNFLPNADGSIAVKFVGPPYYGLQAATIQLHFAGATIANSIPTILDNTVYQLALSIRDGVGGRFFPLVTGNKFITPTPSFAQVNGQAVRISWQINNPVAPTGAYDYQWLITKPPVTKVLDVLATSLNYISGWDAHANLPGLGPNVGTVGDTYQITTPSIPTDTVNLGNGGPYNTGDYVVFNGQSWGILPKSFGDLTSTGNILAFSLNPLNLFNSQYSELGVSTVLSYDFAPGDRCTLHYYLNGSTKVFINNPCVNLSVFGYDSGNYIVKVEKSATFNTSVLTGKNVFLRLYSPAPQDQTVSTTQNGTVWYEIGERFTITNGQFDVLSGTLTDGGAYYKTRQFDDGLLPYTNPPVSVLATDLNYSDFYISPYSSFGRPRSYYDELEKTERKAVTITSQQYILGSKKNGLTRFYPADTYGEADGQTSSSYGAIQATWQRGDVFLIIQELNIFYVPVNIAYIQLNAQQAQEAISEKILNNGRYETLGRGLGKAKEAFCYNENTGWIVDPNYSDIFEITTGGVQSISGKMSKYLKQVLALAYSNGYKIVLFYNRYYNELMVCIETLGGVLTIFPFSPTSWNAFNNYNIAAGDVTATPNGSHSTASYNSSTGIVTYTPTADYVGNDVASFTFNTIGGPITVNNCLNWTAGVTLVNGFSFAAQTNVALNTEILSNTVLVSGNTVPVVISITGGQYSVNGGAFTAAAGVVNQYDVIQVENLSSNTNATTTNAVLSIGTPPTTGTFSVTTSLYQNVAINANYRKNDCGSGQSGTFVFVNIAAGTYSSSISQADADAQAQAAAQAEANAEGTCLVNATISTVLVDYLTDINADLCCFVQTAALDETGLIVTGTIESPSGPLLLPNDGTDPSNCFLLSSDKLGSPSPAWRFGINTAYFAAKYAGTAVLSVTFRIQGRDTSAGVCSLSYGARPITQGYLTLGGTTGSRIPGVSAGSSSPVTVSSHIASGANGTVGTGVGSPVLDIIYTLATLSVPDSITTTTY